MNSEQAINKAINFARRHGNPFVRLVSFEGVGAAWQIRLDVGAFHPDYRTVKIDASGKVVSFRK